jgi:hypothetical protein
MSGKKIKKYFSERWWIFLAILFPYVLIYFSGLPESVSRITAWLILFFLLPVGIFSWYCWRLVKEIKSGKEKSVLEDQNRNFISFTRRKWNLVLGLFLIGLITYVYAGPVANDIWGLYTSKKTVQEKLTNFTDVHILFGGLYFIYQSVQVPGFDKKFYLLYFLNPCQIDKFYELKYLENSHLVISLKEVPQK